jgi:CheY-like chemotaxis protein
MKTRTLFVEDERWGVSPYFNELEKNGFDCELAKDGDEAINKLQTKQFDLVSMDVSFPPGKLDTLPIKAGLKLLGMIRQGKIKNCEPDIKVAILTAVINSEIENEIKQLGISAYLKKPIEFNKVIETFCGMKYQEEKGLS